jgi:hypothetical protein
MPPVIGTRVLPPFPINEVAKISILAPGTNIVLVKTQGLWAVATRFNYPAKFSKIVESLQELDELKIGQAQTIAPADLAKFNLLPPPTNTAADPAAKAGTLIQLFNEQNQPLISLLIGKPFLSQATGPMAGMGSFPNGQYVSTSPDKVYLVAKSLARLTESTKYWLDEEFISVPADDILELTVTGPERVPLALRRAQAGDPLVLDGLAKEETADAGKIGQLAGALNYLGFDDVAAPTLTAKEAGLDRPIVVQARTRQDRIYTLNIGSTLTNDTFDRYVQLSVTQAPPAALVATNAAEAKPDEAAQKKKDEDARTLADKTRALNAKLSPWIYTIKSYRIEPFLTKREEIVKKPEPPKPEDAAPATNAPAIKPPPVKSVAPDIKAKPTE